MKEQNMDFSWQYNLVILDPSAGEFIPVGVVNQQPKKIIKKCIQLLELQVVHACKCGSFEKDLIVGGKVPPKWKE